MSLAERLGLNENEQRAFDLWENGVREAIAGETDVHKMVNTLLSRNFPIDLAQSVLVERGVEATIVEMELNGAVIADPEGKRLKALDITTPIRVMFYQLGNSSFALPWFDPRPDTAEEVIQIAREAGSEETS